MCVFSGCLLTWDEAQYKQCQLQAAGVTADLLRGSGVVWAAAMWKQVFREEEGFTERAESEQVAEE